MIEHYLCIQIRASAAGLFCYPRFHFAEKLQRTSACPVIIPGVALRHRCGDGIICHMMSSVCARARTERGYNIWRVVKARLNSRKRGLASEGM